VDGDSGGEWSAPNPISHSLLRANADLTPALIAQAIAKRLKKMGLDADTTARIDAQLAVLDAKHNAMQVLEVKADRQPWFCSGCPHNTSTKVPEGSRAMAGIGCHFMSLWMDRSTSGFTQMGGEGVPWVGQQPFSNDQHIFANIGDGTYFHSGILAVRQSVAAGVNITYKILYNDAVAMTGGQPIGERAEGHSVVQIAQSMRAEGAKRIVIVTDEPEKYDPVGQNGVPGTLLGLPEGVAIEHRDELDRVQRFMREIKGCTVIIYDQTCATEKRRRRKRGTMVDPAVRVVINEAVCEGCGDCSSQSNCLSVEPLETELGRKRSINQSTCNKDQSCVKGFCPSFVTVEGGQLRKKNKTDRRDPAQLGELPDPEMPSLTSGVYPGGYGIVVAGVGGTGVITIGQLLGMAAHLEGKGIVTQDSAGLAQKGGATWSHVLIAQQQDEIRTTRVSTAAADLILGCDPIVTAGKETMVRMRPGRTRVAINGLATPTAAFVKNGAWANPSDSCLEDILQAVGNEPKNMGAFDANQVSTQLLGDSIFINPMVMGFAWQRGWIPLTQDAIMRAIELNGVQVEANKLAFTWGRWCAQDLDKVLALTQPLQVVNFKVREPLQAILQKRMGWLEQYQNKAYAKQYMSFVQDVQQKTSAQVAEAVARNLYKLMAYKDEYEVARLHADPVFLQRIADQFEGDFTLNYHLAPPLIAKKNDKGELVKQKFGPSMLTGFKLLSRLRFLRGGVFDVFGYTEERRMERALIDEYKASISEVMATFAPGKHALALEIARIPEKIKGYGHVKERHLKAAREQWDGLMHAWRT
jgi:indolepyruvate ferredoxin oxidoreductase